MRGPSSWGEWYSCSTTEQETCQARITTSQEVEHIVLRDSMSRERVRHNTAHCYVFSVDW